MIHRKVIGFLYQRVLRRILFLLDPEFVHDRFLTIGYLLGQVSLTRIFTRKLLGYENSALVQNIYGIQFANPVGLSEGFDKDGVLVQIAGSVGFGFTQVGSVTLNPYGGNPKPRLYRLKRSRGIVVNYGLKNIGADKIIGRLRNLKMYDYPVSISIAKTNAEYTSSDEAGIQDYYDCMKRLVEEDVGSVYTINISCPNTFGGEPFTTPNKLDQLLSSLDQIETRKPVWIKMPINPSWEEFDQLLRVAVSHNVQGVVIGNLQKDHKHPSVKDLIPEHIKGGISGKPTWDMSNELISMTYSNYAEKLLIVGVGGIFSAEDAYEKIKRGASLVQVIAGMVYQGPQLIGQINQGLVDLLLKDGYSNVSEAIGAYHRK
jgi:dihydroorotate dehydrogenase subfamily 2